MFQGIKQLLDKRTRSGRVYDWLFIVSALLCTFLFLAFFFDAWPSTAFLGEVFSSLSGAAIVAVITLLLLDGQTKSENEVQQNTAIFRKKLEIYQEFLKNLNSIVVKRNLSSEDKINMQFQVAYISIHTDSKRLRTISGQVYSIIRKMELDNPINGDIYNELYQLSMEFHNELYNDKWEVDNEDLQSAIQNFSCLGVAETNEVTYKRLLWLEDSVSLYPVSTRIVGGKDLHIRIGILPEVKETRQLVSSEMNIVVHLEKDLSGKIYLYTDDQTVEGLQKILSDRTLWNYSGALKYKNALLGVEHIKNVAVLCELETASAEDKYLRCLYDTLGMMNVIWWRDGMKISRRKIGSTSNEIQVLLSFKKENGASGTVIDEKIIQ